MEAASAEGWVDAGPGAWIQDATTPLPCLNARMNALRAGVLLALLAAGLILVVPGAPRDFPLTVALVAGDCRPAGGEPLVAGSPVPPGTRILVKPESLLELVTAPGGRLRTHRGEFTFRGLTPEGRCVLEIEKGLYFLDFTQGSTVELHHGPAILLGKECRLRIEDRDGVLGIEVLEGFVWPVRGDQLGDTLPAGSWQPFR